MRLDRVETRRIRLTAVAFALSLLACDSQKNPTDPGGGPDPFPDDGAYLSEIALITPLEDYINDAPPDWSPDGRRIVFSGKIASSVWTMTLSSADVPVLVSSPTATGWLDGSYTPNYLGDGRICYYMGWAEAERAMRLMAADTLQVLADPPPLVLRRFRGSSIGLSDYQASSPRLLSMSGDGLRAVGLWRDVFTLDWTDAEDPVRPASRAPEILADAVGLRISRDGSRIAFETGDGDIAWMEFDGDDAEIIGQGRYPSWRGDGLAIGYVSTTGTAYRVHDLTAGSTVSYRTSGAELRHACLSWDGRRVAYLNRDGDELALGYGILMEGDAPGAAPEAP